MPKRTNFLLWPENGQGLFRKLPETYLYES